MRVRQQQAIVLLISSLYAPCRALVPVSILFDSSNAMHRDIQYHPEQPQRITDTVQALNKFIQKQQQLQNDVETWELVDVATDTQNLLGEEAGSVRHEPFSVQELEHAKHILLQTHDPDMIVQLQEKCDNARQARIGQGKDPLGHLGYVDPDTFLTTGTFDVCLRATAAWIRAVEWAQQRQRPVMALTRPPGHHATRDLSNGFCITNFAAAAALHVLWQYESTSAAKRVSILDWDVHYGQGCSDILQHHPQVRYVSMHQTPAFPYMGESLGISGEHNNILTLPVRAESSWTCGYKDVFQKALTFVSKQGEWSPDVVIVCAGYDALDSDELASCSLQASDFGKMSRWLQQHLRDQAPNPQTPPALVFGLEGGYQLSPRAGGGNLQQAVVETLQALQ